MPTAAINRPARALGLAVIVGLGVLLATETIRRTAAHRYADSDPALALAFEPADPDARENEATRLTGLVLTAHSSIGAARAEDQATRLIRAEPMRVSALRDLGLLADASGDRPRAAAIMAQAAARGYRDTATQAWLLRQALTREDLAAALPRLDAVLRVSPEMEPRLFPALFTLLSVPDGARSLAAWLVAKPPWRDRFLVYAALDAPMLDPGLDLFHRLDALNSPPGDAAESALLYRLVGDGRFGEARALWLAKLPPRLRNSGAPYDGNFRGLPGPAPFNWHYELPAGERLRLEHADDGRPVLAIDVPGEHAQPLAGQLVMLTPGAWRLSADVRVRSPASGAAITLDITCAGAGSPIASLRQDASSSRGWGRLSQAFTVPANCPAQRLRIATSPSDGFGEISADLTGVALTRAGAP